MRERDVELLTSMVTVWKNFMMVEKFMQIKKIVVNELDDNDCEEGYNVDDDDLMIIKNLWL